MDNFLYIAASGAKQNMNQLATHANNLANARSDGFKADMSQARSMQAYGEGLPTRVFAMTERPSSNFDPGSITETGRKLDVAIENHGWMVVEDSFGNEALSRSGSLVYDDAGMLMNSDGQPLLGQNGPIFLPLPIEHIEIAKDGLISVRPQGAPANAMEQVGQLRLTNPELKNLVKGEDGLFRDLTGQPYQPAVDVSIRSGAIEGSNVSAIKELVGMIEVQRQFDMQLKMMKAAEENDKANAKLLG